MTLVTLVYSERKQQSFSNQFDVCAFDMFCSVGGLTYGLQKAGIKVNAGLDIDGSCRHAYEANCFSKFYEKDIRNVSYSNISEDFKGAKYRILVGCAPCQPFSKLTAKLKYGKSDSRWKMIDEFLRIILEGRPEIISMENVPPLMKTPIYNQFKQALIEAGYYISDGILACYQFGVPQSRCRLVVLGSLLDKIEIPKPLAENPKTVRQTIGKLPPIQQGQSDETDPLHVCAGLWPINVERIRASKPGGSWRDWPAELLLDCYKKESGFSYQSVYGRIEWDTLAPTITTQFYGYGTGRFGHPEQDRALSLREGAMLQTFPQNYKFLAPGEKVRFEKIGRHIGNAVPPSLASAIGKAIVRHIEKYNLRNEL